MTLKKTVALGGRVVVSVGVLAFLAWKIESSSSNHGHGKNAAVLPGWTSKTALWLALAFVLTFVSMVIAAQRWRAVLHALDVEDPPPLRRLLSIYLSGFFVGNALPSTVGGDVLRVTRLSADLGGETPASFASVVLERFTGWLVLPVLVLVGFGINRGFLQYGHARSVALVIALVTLAGLAVVWVALSHPRIGGRLGRAEGWRRFAGAVHYGADQIQRRPVALVSVIGWSFAYQIVVVLAGFSAARTLGVPAIGPTAMLTFYPAVLIAQVLPISISGLGVREGLFVLFLHPLGVPTGKAVALGILIYLLTLVVSMLGAPGFALGAGRRTATRGPDHDERAVVTQ